MGVLARRVLSVAGAVLLFATLSGFGVAYADPLAGKTYADATEFIAKYNGKPVIATVVGSEVSTKDCIVTSSHISGFLDASGKNARGNEWVLSLNCTNPLAAPGKPGNSAASPAGIDAKRLQDAAANIKKDPTFCYKRDVDLQFCKNVCRITGLCDGSSL